MIRSMRSGSSGYFSDAQVFGCVPVDGMECTRSFEVLPSYYGTRHDGGVLYTRGVSDCIAVGFVMPQSGSGYLSHIHQESYVHAEWREAFAAHVREMLAIEFAGSAPHGFIAGGAYSSRLPFDRSTQLMHCFALRDLLMQQGMKVKFSRKLIAQSSSELALSLDTATNTVAVAQRRYSRSGCIRRVIHIPVAI